MVSLTFVAATGYYFDFHTCKNFTSQNFHPIKISPVKFSPLATTGEIGENLSLAKISRYTVLMVVGPCGHNAATGDGCRCGV